MSTCATPPCLPLPDVLEAHSQEILQRWEARVGEVLGEGAPPLAAWLRGAPGLVDALVDLLRGPCVARDLERARAFGGRLGRERYEAGVRLETLVREYALLRGSIFEVLDEAGWQPDLAALRRLDQVLDVGLSDAVAQYGRGPGQDACAAERDEARELLGRIVTQLPIVIWAADARGVITLCEGEGLKAIGVDGSQLVGRSTYEVYGDRPDLLEATRRAQAGECFSMELEMGSAWFAVRITPVHGPDGRVVSVAGVSLDITERRAAEQEARRRAEFEQLLIGIVGHDLRNPISAITMATTTLLRREDLDERHRKVIGRILSSAERATRMLRDVLDFTQARLGGGIPMQPRPFDLHELTRQVVDEVQLAHPEHRLVVEGLGDGRGQWDADRLAQVITNLVNNAIHHSSDEGPVRVRTRGTRGAVALAVYNPGPAIPAELRSRLFEPMKRAERKDTRDSRGLGLGLFIVKHIVDAHGGRVRVRSTGRGGTTFLVRLPRRPGWTTPAPGAAHPDV